MHITPIMLTIIIGMTIAGIYFERSDGGKGIFGGVMGFIIGILISLIYRF